MNPAHDPFAAFRVFHGSLLSAFLASGVPSGSLRPAFPTPGVPSRLFRLPFPTSGMAPRTFSEPFPVPGMPPRRFRQAFPVPGTTLGTLRLPFPTLRMAPGTLRRAFPTLRMVPGTSRMAFQTFLSLCIPPFSAVPASRNHSSPFRASFGITSSVFHTVQRSSPKRTETPNHALQRTATRVTLAAVHVRGRLVRARLLPTSVASFFASPSQPSRRAPRSLSLRSLGDCGAF